MQLSSATPNTPYSSRRAPRIFLGQGKHGPLWGDAEICALILGPPRSGKTSSIIIPNVLLAQHSVISISTKTDVLEATMQARLKAGPCFIFDPTEVNVVDDRVCRIGWSPLVTASSWERAILNAEAMVGSSGTTGAREHSHWHERASALLATLFHAAALDRSSMDRVVQSVHRRDADHFLEVLARRDANHALDLLIGIRETDVREQSGIWSTASGVLSAYRSDGALRNALLPPIDWGRFVSAPSALYVTAPTDHQQHVAPLIAGLIRDLRSYCYANAANERHATPFGVLLILDELANIAPLHDLPALVAEGASQGIVTLASLQDLTQAKSRWGVAGDGFLSLFGAKVIFGGIGDHTTLRQLSALGGDHYIKTRTLSRRRHFGRWTASSTQSSVVREPRLPVSAIATPPPNQTTVLIGARPYHCAPLPYYRLLRSANFAPG